MGTDLGWARRRAPPPPTAPPPAFFYMCACFVDELPCGFVQSFWNRALVAQVALWCLRCVCVFVYKKIIRCVNEEAKKRRRSAREQDRTRGQPGHTPHARAGARVSLVDTAVTDTAVRRGRRAVSSGHRRRRRRRRRREKAAPRAVPERQGSLRRHRRSYRAEEVPESGRRRHGTGRRYSAGDR